MISDWIHSWQHYLWSSNLIIMIIKAMKQGLAWWLPVSCHCLYQCCLIINEALWQPPNAKDTNQARFPSGWWVKIKSRASSASGNVSTNKSILATIMWISTFITHWGRVTHICISKLIIIGSDNGLSAGQCQAIIWTNAGILSIGPLGTNVSKILIEIHTFSFKKMYLKMLSGHFVSATMY